MSIHRLGIDLAKNVFELCGMDRNGKVVLRNALRRDQLMEFFAQLPPCQIAMESCGGAHHWARFFQASGHEVRLIAPQFVAPYRKISKNDANDAEAICEASGRPTMRFVAIKSTEQQAMLALHRAQELAKFHLTALGNQVRGLLAEFGVVIPQGPAQLRKALQHPIDLETLPPIARNLFRDLFDQRRELTDRLAQYDQQIAELSKADAQIQRLMTIPGVGPVTATAVVATVDNARIFKNGRQFSAWIGLVPKQKSSGGKSRLLGITERGDIYLRTLLVQGATTVVHHLGAKEDGRSRWIRAIMERRGKYKAVVALAARMACTIWALMTREENYRVLTNDHPVGHR
ncbi:IS110 family RNA-guided transposase [Acidithiobacillus caldus]|uniref:Transposase n=1 Tax=Acidithiobacillus caldus TaxID=33059 RepID=A0A1E7YSC8_9PROT|nr:IS110 family transposase [Acidithiobacillus caldus]MBU2762685.1 IS110 family transposase [Acidithiobacillus caldus]MBU2771614.1 IS110 family transposase [Acidithiobacillus caldus]MBU2781959.1 IS110 family transposase [Acidithiobacillus caldus]OFC43599.1 transposase [Acidithiobacillus caldus]